MDRKYDRPAGAGENGARKPANRSGDRKSATHQESPPGRRIPAADAESSRQAKSGENRPTTGDRRSYSDTRRPATGEHRPATGARRPASGESRPGTGEHRSFSSERRPATGERRSFDGDRRPPTGERRSFDGDRRPPTGEHRSFSSERRPATGERRSFDSERRPATGERRSFDGDRRPPTGEHRPFNSDRRPPTGERPSFDGDRRPPTGERRSFDGDRRPPTGERRSFDGDRRPPTGERRSFDGDRRPPTGERRSFDGDRRPPTGERRSFSSDRRPTSGAPSRPAPWSRDRELRESKLGTQAENIDLPKIGQEEVLSAVAIAAAPIPLPVPDLPIPQILEPGTGLPDRLEGRNPILEAIKAGRTINKLWIAKREERPDPTLGRLISLAREAGAVIMEVDRRALDAMSTTHSHQGAIAQVAAHEYIELEDLISSVKARDEAPFLLILAELQESYNLGSILRIADAAGVHGVIIPTRRSVGLDAAVAKASAGAIEHVPVARVGNLTQTILTLKKEGFWIAGTDADGKTDYHKADWQGPLAILIGSEGEGLSPVLRRHCDFLISIPMFGKVNSLNAAVAAGIITFEAAASRKAAQKTEKAERPPLSEAETAALLAEADLLAEIDTENPTNLLPDNEGANDSAGE
jgi:23S rRNA (guanosine2251-2'-O)-methyltransferase